MKTNIFQKVGIALTSVVMMFSSALGNISSVSAKETSYLIREYETGYKTDRGTNLLKLRIKGDDIPDYGTHWGQVAFCVQHGESLPKGSHIYNSGDPAGTYKKAARIAYLATYRYNNGESGGMERYAFTQNLIWQVIGQAPSSYSVGSGYADWKAGIMAEYNKWDTMPSFHSSTQTFELGQSKTLQDTNGVLQYYNTFNYTKDGVTFTHTKGSNSMKVTVSENCSKESVAITTADAKKSGISKYENSNSTQVNFVLKSTEKQDLICTPGFNDPKYLNIKIDISLYGNLEIAKKDNKGNFVPNVQFKISYNKDMSDPIGTYKTGTNGKVTVSNLKPSTVYIQETDVPSHLILDKTIHSVKIESNKTATYTAVNDWKQAYIQVTKRDAKTKQVVKKAGTVFEVLSGDKVIETITTNSEGIAKTGLLDYGTYIIREKKEPANYTIATLTENQSVTENNTVYKIDIFNEPVLGKINLSKVDKETEKKAQGDATLSGAQYTLKAKNNIYNPADDSILYKAGDTISVKTVGNSTYGDTGTKTVDSNYNITWSNLPMGVYEIVEAKAPTGYQLDASAHSVTLQKTSSTKELEIRDVISQEEVTKAYLQVIKKDAKTGLTVQKAGTVFEILYKNKVIETITTNTQGIAKSGLLPYGTYVIREKKEPANYTIATLTKSQKITENGKVYSITMENEPVLGKINLSKVDKETEKKAQGDATLSGAQYALKAKNNIYNPANDSILYKAGDIISVKTVGNSTYGDTGTKTVDSNYNITWSNLPMGIYEIVEVKAPTGYLLDPEAHSITLQKTSSTKALEIKSAVSKEDVIKGRLSVAKSGNDGSSGVMNGLAGVEFTMKLKSEVNAKGWDNARTYSTITTDATGRGTSSYVPYGIYIVRETKTPDNYIKSGDFFVNIDKDQEIEYRMVNNAPFKTWLQLVKTDMQGNTVKLSSATFKIKDSKGNYLKQKVGLFYKDEWSTDKEGMVILDDMVKAGTYYLEEIKSPDGFLLSDNVKFTIDSENKEITFDDEGDPVLRVTIKNEKPTGTIVLNKTFEKDEHSVAPDKEELQAQFQLIANSEIIDPADGKIIYHKGDIVKINGSEDGIYSTVKGKLEIANLPLGTKGASYILKEVKTENGYVLVDNPIIFEFSINNNTTKVYKEVKGLENKLTTAYFQKTDVAGKEVEGAKLVLFDEQGKVIDQWTSTKEAHIIKGLIIGDTYKLHEEVCADGYVKATDITFTFKENNQKTTMIDKIVSISKTDVTGTKEIAGAKLTVLDKDGKIVDEWISSDKEHRVKGLEEGKTYTLVETTAPEGYVKAEKIEFMVTKEKINQEIIMKDKVISFTKTDMTGEKELEGAHIKVTDEEGNTVDEWTSTKEAHNINNLEEGKVYTLTEVTAPEGYIRAESIQFEVSTDKENQTILMKDKQVSIQKIDQNGHAVIGAKLQIIDKENSEVIETFVTDGNIYYSKNVEIGKTYILKEIEVPENYVKSDDIEFSVSKEDENQEITMTDIKLDKVLISKQDATTKEELEGAHLKITDEEGNTVDEWVSSKEPHEVMLIVGKTYTLTETTAPNGYNKAESIQFTVADNGEVVQKVIMLDQHKPTVIKTGDDINILPYTGVALCALAGILVLRKRGKTDEQ